MSDSTDQNDQNDQSDRSDQRDQIDPDDTYAVGGAGLPVAATDHPFDHEYPPRGFQQAALEWMYGDDTAPVAAVAAPTGGGKTDVITSLAEATDHLLCVYPTNALVEAQRAAIEAAGLSVETITADSLSGTGFERAEDLLQTVQSHHRDGRDVLVTNPDILQAVLQNLYFSPGSRILEVYAQFDAAVYDEFHYYDPLAASGLLTQIKILSERGAYRTPDGKRLPKVLLSSATPDRRFLDYVRDDLALPVREIRSELRPLDTDRHPDAPMPDVDLVYQTPAADGAEDGATGGTEPVAQIDVDSQAVGDPTDPTTAQVSFADLADGASRFRYPMVVRRHQEAIGDAFPAIADGLAETVASEYTGDGDGDPVAAVIFNSAARSNDFQRFLASERPDLAEVVVKDNGYDTRADRPHPDEMAVLNTTSKGEVGLDFDIRHLVMATPATATQFVQRIGRAGRQSPAIVDVYGLADPGWPSVQSYPGFLRRVIPALGDPETRQDRLRTITGMRAAEALRDRTDDDVWHNEAIYEDFADFPGQSRWRGFFEALDEAESIRAEAADSMLGPSVGGDASDAIRAAIAVRDGLSSLRGRTLSHPVTYPRGDRRELTEYSLPSALAHYSIDRVGEDDVLHLVDDLSPGPLRGYYPGAPNGGDGVDLLQSRRRVAETLRAGYRALVDRADLSSVPVDADTLDQFFGVMPVESALVPERLRAGRYVIDCDPEYGTVTDVARRE